MRILKKIGSTEFLLLCGVIGPPLFFVVLLIEGATRPGYVAWQTQGSYLALSDQGWEQITNFLVFGSLLLAFAGGLRRIWHTGRASVWGPLLVGLLGLGMVLLGAFVADPGDGYPPGTPFNIPPHTWHGWAHGITGLVWFIVVLPAACFVLARRFAAEPQNRRWATYSWMTGALILLISTILTTIVIPIAQASLGLPVIDGLIQRVEIFIGWTWLALTALRLWREARKAGSEEASTRLAGTSANAD